MNILLIIPTEYKSSRWGGVMTYTLSLAHEIKSLSHHVTILTPGKKNEHFTDHSISIVTIAYAHSHFPIFSLLSRLLPLFTDRMRWMIGVYTFIKRHGPFDIIEAPEWGSSTLLLSLAGERNIVTRLHRSLLQYHKDNDLPITLDLKLVNCLEMWSTIAAGGITSPTHYIIKSHPMVTRLYTLFRIPTAIIPNGVFLRSGLLYPHSRAPYVLTVGRLERGKGQLLLIKAFAQIADKIPSVNLIMVGRDTEVVSDKKTSSFKKKLEHEIIKYHLKKRILIKKQMTQEQLVPFYQRCLIYVAPSIGHENHPIALLDAIGWGKAVIGSNTGGIPEIVINEKNGLLCIANDASDLANKLEYLIRNTEVRKRYETYNKTHRLRFDVRRTAKLTLNFYQKVRSV